MVTRTRATKVRALVAVLILAFAASSSGLTSEVYAESVTSTPSADSLRTHDEETSLAVAVVAGAAAGAVAGAVRGLVGLPDGVAAGAALGFIGGGLGAAVGWGLTQVASGAGGCSAGGDPSGCELAPHVPENALDFK